ncbi:nucleotidyltransferase family protein [Xenorhabdus sp. PR6a]|uniref:nucleotidyltransferase family protein n=1 Tax=Xenorhabdus sp. PR6a TaxID=3025877 RepID=UPI0023595EA9|nr:nucleotidyltransferase family protein [Xenorhabdus sp. PR6a]MDC9580529.1 nucleotidyltransferase family protein [Xenorhabdus sp. PR6a]
MEYQTSLQKILSDDPVRMKILYAVRALELNDGWIGAGFVRDAVWDQLHGYGLSPVYGDVDVVWFDCEHCSPDHVSYLEDRLRKQLPSLDWSVKNQARMHQRNRDHPYTSTGNALLHWPETATAVAVRLGKEGLDITAPYGLSDLFELRLRPTPAFEREKLDSFKQRVTTKQWLERYPRLKLIVSL